jgi:tRNA-dihydrouridine synthase B
MRLGNLEIKGKLFLAPMCNVTALPFRVLCKKYGAAVVYSEMIHADAYLMESEKTRKRAVFLDEERPVGLQLTGSSPELVIKAAVKAEKEYKPDLIDINIGCPAYNVIKSGGGSALLKEPEKLKKLITGLSKSISAPLTCKIRILQDDDSTIKIARIIEKAGAKAITVHGRTAKQRYSGKANWEAIKKVKKSIGIPVILNGDVRDEMSAEKALKTGCDAIMIGRAAIGNPFLFKRIKSFLETGEMLPSQDIKEKMKDFSEFVSLCRKYDYLNIIYIKMQAENFAKGFVGAAGIRKKISDCKSIEEIMAIVKKI